ncbi:MAG: hypothetical protein JO279_07860 [Verrucomicrobia bacterium]|nr:hypothetical protein [Verrucomicrobiota bacterium]
MARQKLSKTAAALGRGIGMRRAIPRETQREFLLAPALLTIIFLHMGDGFMRIHDIWQVFEGKKCKKKSIPAKKCKKPSFIVRGGIAPKSITTLCASARLPALLR